jgi:2-keto-myo-inositol isomerase
VHVSDVPSTPIDRLQESERLYCGEGILDWKRILGELERWGYEGDLSVELFNEGY